MIFVTVGAQMPFDRMVRTVDEWAGRHNRSDVFAQIGPTRFQPRHVPYSRFLSPGAFRKTFQDATAIISHAGMGTIINAMEFCKPILVMPRRSDLGETRNDHQIATAKQFRKLDLVDVAMNEHKLLAKLEVLTTLRNGKKLGSSSCPLRLTCPLVDEGGICAEHQDGAACPKLVSSLKAFVADAFPTSQTLMIPSGEMPNHRPGTTRRIEVHKQRQNPLVSR